MELQIVSISIDQLDPAPWNPRTAADPAGLENLTNSIRTHGVLQPLLVRAAKGDRYQIVAGHRRTAAAGLAELKTIPCVVLDVDDETAQTKAIVEQLQRENLTPLDEARAFRALLNFKRDGQTAAAIGRRIGKPERYVWEQVRLLELVPDAQQLLQAGILPLPHALILSTLTAADQKRAIALSDRRGESPLFKSDMGFGFEDEKTKRGKWDGLKTVSARELQGWVNNHVRFNPVQAAAAAPLDFGPVAEQVQTAAAQPGRGKKVVSITHDSYVHPDAKDADGARTFCCSSWKRADGQEKSETCEHAILGVVVVGPGYGEAFLVCVHKDCDVHWKAERLAREKQAARSGGGSTRAADQYAKQDRKRRERQAQQDGERKAWAALEPAITKALAAAIRGTKATRLADLVLEAVEQHGTARQTAAVKYLGTPRTAELIVQHAAFIELVIQMQEWDAYEKFPKVAKRYGVDIAAIRKAQPSSPAFEAGTCRKCGCTEDEPCAGGCRWADATMTLCTACVDKKPAAAPAKATTKAKSPKVKVTPRAKTPAKKTTGTKRKTA